MPKIDDYVQLAAQTAREIAADGETWRSFLQTASTLYKYGFYDQMMIYAQRPDATACASFELWTNTMRRYVRRGAKGIALLDMTGDVPRYHYVFDAADTGTRKDSRSPFVWAVNEENSAVIGAMLEKEYEVSANRGLAGQLEEIAMQKAMDYWQEHQDELRDIVDGSLLMEYDELNLELAFRNTATTGVQYMLFSRCGLAEEHRFEPEDFTTILEWNTPQALTALGTAVSEISEEVLRSIEREARSVERSRPYAELQNGERLSDSRPENPGRAGDAGQIRQDAQGVSEGAQKDDVQQPAADGRTDGASGGNRPDGGRAGEPHGQRDGGGAGRERSAEGTRPDGVGRRDEQPESAGRGNRTDRAGVRLNPGQTSLFETITEYGEGADDRAVSAPSFISKALDTALRFGGNGEDTRMELAFDAMIGKTNEEIALRMKTLYHDGSGFELDGRRFSVWFDPSGIQMAAGDRARYANNAQVISWTDAAKRVGALIEAGQFGTQLENVEAPGTIRRKVAERLIYMYRDSAARENGYLSLMTDTPLIFPDCVNHLSEKMEQPEFLHGLIRQMEVFADAVTMQPDLMRFRFLLPKDILPRLRDLALARKELPEGEMLLPDVRGFMTQDEIDAVLTQSAPIAGAGSRIYQFFSAPHSTNEKLEFLKNEYGIGGRMPGVSGEHGSSESHDAKGIQLRKSNCPDVLLKWNQVAERIDRLIHDGHYLKSDAPNRKEPEISFTLDVEAYKRLKDEHPRRLVGVRVDDTLLFYGDDAKIAAPLMDTRLFERNIPGMGAVSVTGMPFGRWSVAAKALMENGHGIYFAEPAEQGGYEVVKELDGRRDEPSYQVGDTVYLGNTAFLIEEITDQHVNLRDSTLLYPISRVERRDTFEQMLAEDTRNDELFYKQTDAMPAESENFVLTEEAPSDPATQQPQEEIRLHNLVIDLTGQETERKEAEPYKAQNFRITDDHLGEGGAKTKYAFNIAAIQTLKQIEAEGRQARPDEQEILSRYVGWGGLPQAFDAENASWQKEYQQLKSLLTDEEYAAARGSTLNAHYTSPVVIRAMYEALDSMGFQDGNVLEPACGVGNFFGMLPESMSQSRLYGVELDSITGRMARQLYPDARIEITGFEKTNRKDFFDVAVGNVPFGNYKVADRAFDKYGFLIHDYFLAKTLEQVRPGGVIAFITSKGTMDKASPDVRRYIAQRAELLGAIRLPNNAFKANAGTEVTSDILFLQKREHPIDIEPDWIHLGRTADGIPINSYFVDHPDMMLGRMQWDKSMYGNEKETTCEPIPGADLAQQLHAAVRNIDGEYKRMELSETDINEGRTIPADPDVRNFSYALVNGQVYYRENSVMTRPVLNQTTQERVKGMIELRDCTRRLIDAQINDATDDDIHQRQDELNRTYDDFTARYGLISDRANNQVFSSDSSYYLLCSLEILDDKGKLKRKADMFTKRTIRQSKPVEHVDTAMEALAVSISEKAGVDLPFMAGLTGKAENVLADELTGAIFCLPEAPDTFVTADEYLSGNVREKLRAARTAALQDDQFAVNVQALENAQPKDLDASEIDVRLGATWLDPATIQQFMVETFSVPYRFRDIVQVRFSPMTAEWNISGKTRLSSTVAASVTYGTDRANAYRILEDTLNLRDVRIYDTVEDAAGRETRVLNQKETTLAQQKQQAIKDAFQKWIWQDPARRQRLVEKYNDLFNSTKPREYDGSHITFSGMNPEITLREHQRNAIAHVLYGGNTLLAHVVGAGKTFEMVASAMESKRLGLCSKSLFVVPNHLTGQWASEFLQLYPSANILVATKRDFEQSRRKKFCARIATGDYDAVIIGHSQFEKIPISQARQERLIEEQIEEITEGIEELTESHGEHFSIKQLEKTKRGLETRLEKLRAEHRKDDVVTFEELGVDRLFVDEAHSYKNLYLYTKMRNVAGLSVTEAQKSSDMFAKCRYMDEITGGKGVIFATGTPVSNSMTELYTMQRYLQYDTLKRKGLAHFDCWASTFGETVTAIELAPEGTGYRARTRFAKFFNLPELMAMFKEAADIKTADQLHLPTPTPHFENISVKPSEYQQEMIQALSERAAQVHSGSVDPKVDNMLKITSDGRKLGLDQRLINPLLPDDPGSKVNACVQNVFRIWREGQADKLTQLLFCDLSTPTGKAPAVKDDAAKDAAFIETGELPADRFNVYDDIREKLVSMGIPREQIAFIHEAKTDVQKKELFSKVRSGDVRILLGSTAKMGAGTNCQDRLIALHDLDAPWRPGDLEQRAGRIIRQGNMNPDVHIYRYVTEQSFDAYLWQTIETKQKFISQIMSSKSPVRACDDVDETALSYAEIKALCAGDPRIKEKMNLDVEVAKLRLMKADHESKRFRLEDQLVRFYPEQLRQQEDYIAGFKADMQTLSDHPVPQEDFVGIELLGKAYADKSAAGETLLALCKTAPHDHDTAIGHYRGLSVTLSYDSFNAQFQLLLRGEMTHIVNLGADARGNLLRIENALNNIPVRMQKAQEQVDSLHQQIEAAKLEITQPFPQELELTTKSARLAELDALLSMDKSAPMNSKSEKPSVLASLERGSSGMQKDTPQRRSDRPLDTAL